MNIWLQKHDFSSEDLPEGSAEIAVSTLKDFDWNSEIKLQEQAQTNNSESCPPGLGIVSENNEILHFCPSNSCHSTVNLTYNHKSKFLGFFPYNQSTVKYFYEVPSSLYQDVINHFYSSPITEVCRLLKPYEDPYHKHRT